MASEITVRPLVEAEWPAFLESMSTAFGSAITDDGRAQWEPFIEFSRMMVATDEADGSEQIVGTAGWLPFDMTVPGGEIPVSAVTMVTVRPTHRRRGILRQMMRRHLSEAHDQGYALATLWASESIIYQRFGYGLAFVRARIDLDPRRADFLGNPAPSGEVRMVTHEEAQTVFPAIYDRVRSVTPASFRRSALWWEKRTLYDTPGVRHGGSPMYRVLLTLDGQPAGYAIYRIHTAWGPDGIPAGWLDVLEAIGTSPAATREIWRYLFGVDLVARVKTFRLCQDHPLLYALADPRQLRATIGDGTWVRVVDVAAALAARRYQVAGTLTVQLRDVDCPWNEGVWTLEASPDGATVRRGTKSPDLVLSAAELSAMYLGTVSASSLARAGRLTELTPGAARRADLLFGWDVPPWCLDDF
ncbi:MAG: GNAT family N-acetyltransferase [Chloroflexota bacterium]